VADITVIERSARRTETEEMNGVQVERKPGPDNDVVGSTIGIIWSATYATTNKLAVHGEVENDRVVRHFRHTLELCPIGSHME
jgi:hypothetical protein